MGYREISQWDRRWLFLAMRANASWLIRKYWRFYVISSAERLVRRMPEFQAKATVLANVDDSVASKLSCR
jgi:hypothetical protein